MQLNIIALLFYLSSSSMLPLWSLPPAVTQAKAPASDPRTVDRNTAYEVGYARGLELVQRYQQHDASPGFSWALRLEARELAWEAVYCPQVLGDEEQGYADALALFEWDN
jgi:hypothetical protein